MIISSLLPSVSSSLAMKFGTPLKAMKRVRSTVPITTMKMPAVLDSVLTTASRKTRSVKRPRSKASTSARKAPTAPASVGVKRPTKMPISTPKTSTGSGQISLIASSFSWAVKLSSTRGAREGFTVTRATIITESITADSSPGMTPAMNSLAMETSA